MGPMVDNPSGLKIVRTVRGGQTGDNLIQTEDGRVWKHVTCYEEGALGTGEERREHVGDRVV